MRQLRCSHIFSAATAMHHVLCCTYVLPAQSCLVLDMGFPREGAPGDSHFEHNFKNITWKMLKQWKALRLVSSRQDAVWDRVSLGTRSCRGSPGWQGRARQPVPSHCLSQGARQPGGSPSPRDQAPPWGQGRHKSGLGPQPTWGVGDLRLPAATIVWITIAWNYRNILIN